MVEFSKIKINYKVFGQENDEVILFIHGLGSCGADFEKQIGFFEKKYKLLIPDLRNHGKSEKSMDVDVKIMAHDLFLFLQDLNIKKTHIVGISLGAMVAMQMALDFTDIVKKLVVINAIPKFPVKNFYQWILFYFRIIFLKIFGIGALGNVIAKILFPNEKHKNLREKFVKNFEKNDEKYYLKTLKSLQKFDISKKIKNIAAPTLFVASSDDYISLARKEKYVKKMQNAKMIVIENSHHGVIAEKADEFNEILSDFLKN